LAAPAHAGPSGDDVNDAFEVTVMVGSGLGVGLDPDGAGPELFSPSHRVRNRGRAIHPRSLRRVRVEVARFDDPHPIEFPPRIRLHADTVRARFFNYLFS